MRTGISQRSSYGSSVKNQPGSSTRASAYVVAEVTSTSSIHGRPISEIGISRRDAAILRAKLESFAADWDDPSMDVYNDL